jgi:hypothetical protein
MTPEERYQKLCKRCRIAPAVRRNVMGSPMWLHDSTAECAAAAEREKDFAERVAKQETT